MGIEYSYELLCKDSMAVFFLGVLSTFLHAERQNCSVGTNDRYGNSHPTGSPQRVKYTLSLVHRAQSVNRSFYQYILILFFTTLAGAMQRDTGTGGEGGQLGEQGSPTLPFLDSFTQSPVYPGVHIFRANHMVPRRE